MNILKDTVANHFPGLIALKKSVCCAFFGVPRSIFAPNLGRASCNIFALRLKKCPFLAPRSLDSEATVVFTPSNARPGSAKLFRFPACARPDGLRQSGQLGTVGTQSEKSGQQPIRHDHRTLQHRLDPEPVPMPLHNTPSTPAPEAEIKPIDYNDSIRSTYFTIDELHECGAALARDGVSSLPGFFPFEFRPRHRENEDEIFRVYKVTADRCRSGCFDHAGRRMAAR